MTDVLIEENPHVDEEDMGALIDEIGTLGYEAVRRGEPSILKAAWWVLTLQWIGDAAGGITFAQALTALARWARQHYGEKREEPPRRIDLFGPDGQVLKSIEVDQSQEEE